jgi:type I restriction enzyme R subunit
MRPIFSPTEYIQIKGRGTRRYAFVINNAEYEKKYFFLLDFCAVAEYFEEKYDYSLPLKVRTSGGSSSAPVRYQPPQGGGVVGDTGESYSPRTDIPVWEGTDRVVKQEVRIVGPNGEKVDVMTFRGSFERDMKEYVQTDEELQHAVETEDDDSIETIVQERFYHRPEMFYSPDKLIISYGVPATTPAFVYNALGKKPLPTKKEIISDTVDSIAARFNLRYNEQKWLNATAELVADDPAALTDFLEGKTTIFERSQFRLLGDFHALMQFRERDAAFEALRQSLLVRQISLAAGTTT